MNDIYSQSNLQEKHIIQIFKIILEQFPSYFEKKKKFMYMSSMYVPVYESYSLYDFMLINKECAALRPLYPLCFPVMWNVESNISIKVTNNEYNKYYYNKRSW